MAVKIKTFHFVRHFNPKIGIYPPQSYQSSFNRINIFFIFMMIQLTVSEGAFYLFKEKNFDEILMSFISSNTSVCTIFHFVLMIWQNGNILKLIEKFDEFIEQSKWKE